MSDLRELYQEVILDHHKRPRNFRRLEEPDRHADGFNPLCGDRLTLDLKMDGEVVREIGFQGVGCAISTASASMMTDAVKGKSVAEIVELFDGFHDLVTGKSPAEGERLGKLAIFAGVRDYPARVKCATLCWHTLKAALDKRQETVATE